MAIAKPFVLRENAKKLKQHLQNVFALHTETRREKHQLLQKTLSLHANATII